MEQVELIRLDEGAVKPKNYHITKSNTLVEASYRLSLTEQRIILLMASLVQPEDENFKQYRLTVSGFMDLLDITRPNLYQQMVSMIDHLMRNVLTIRVGENDYVKMHWIDKARYTVGSGYVDVTFDPELKPFFLHLKEKFTTYRLENVMRLKSIYSIRIYELLKQYQGFGKRTITIEDLRKMLGIKPEEYKTYNNLKRKVILVAYREINEKTDISFTFREIKQVRKVHAIEFTITQKQGAKPDKTVRQKEKELKKKEKEERQKAAHREKVQAYLNRLSPQDLAELKQEAEEMARTEGGNIFRQRDIPAAVIQGYVYILAEKRMKLTDRPKTIGTAAR